MEARWSDRFPLLFDLPVVARWFTVQIHLGLAPATLDGFVGDCRDWGMLLLSDQSNGAVITQNVSLL